MATSTIKTLITKGIASSPNQGENASGSWERVGNIVAVKATLTHPNTSWTILTGFPRTKEDCVIGVVSDHNSPNIIKHLVWMTVQGSLQIRTGIWSDVYNFSGSYLCE